MFEYIRKIPTKEEILENLPLKEELKEIKQKRDEELKQILEGKSDKFIVIVGPCSADNEESVMEYAKRLGELNEKLKDKLYMIPRIYTNKPRSNGEGYKGMLHQPNLDETPNLSDGINAIRRLHIRVLEETGMTSADEMLYPDNLVYLEDLLGYIAIGARSVENQQHRLVSSGINVPVGMKNPTSGDLSIMFNSIHAAQKGHEFIYHNWEVQTLGNPHAHAILRGFVDKKGIAMQNYHYEDLMNTIQEYKKTDLKNSAVIVDVSHANSNKNYKEQTRIAKEVLHSIRHSEEIRQFVKGVMIESYLVEGKQDIDSPNRIYGKSVTDACIGWEETEELLYYIAENR